MVWTPTYQAKVTYAGVSHLIDYGRCAVSGKVLVVGAPEDDTAGADAGAAYVSRQASISLWSDEAKLIASTATAGDKFGFDADIDDTSIIVGAPYHNTTGAAYIFDFSGSAWPETVQLDPPVIAWVDCFGGRVKIKGDYAFCSAVRESYSEGALHVFKKVGGVWGYWQKLVAPSPDWYSYYADSFDFDGTTLLVGHPGKSSNDGKAYTYTLDGGGYFVFQQELVALPLIADNKFGGAVRVDGNRAVVVAGDSSSTKAYWQIYVFKFSTTWALEQYIDPVGLGANLFDDSRNVALNNSLGFICIGSNFADPITLNEGKVWFYELNGTTWTYDFSVSGTINSQYLGKRVCCDGSTFCFSGGLEFPNSYIYVYGITYTPDGLDEIINWKSTRSGYYCHELTDGKDLGMTSGGQINRDYTVASRARMRLLARRGEWIYDPSFGSRFHTIKTQEEARADCLTFAVEALQPLIDEGEIWLVEIGEIDFDAYRGSLAVEIFITIPSEEERVSLGKIRIGA